jgi:hypothetical protein
VNGRRNDPILELILRIKLYIIEIASLAALAWIVYQAVRHEVGF